MKYRKLGYKPVVGLVIPCLHCGKEFALTDRNVRYYKYSCPKCEKDKNRAYTKKWVSGHREKHNTRVRAWQTKHPECVMNRRFKHEYGITLNEAKEILLSQGGACAICGNSIKLGNKHDNKGWVDHCHSTGVVRGILCPNCNSGIGKFHEDADLMIRAIKYINPDWDESEEDYVSEELKKSRAKIITLRELCQEKETENSELLYEYQRLVGKDDILGNKTTTPQSGQKIRQDKEGK